MWLLFEFYLSTDIDNIKVYGFATQEENLDIFLNKMKTYT